MEQKSIVRRCSRQTSVPGGPQISGETISPSSEKTEAPRLLGDTDVVGDLGGVSDREKVRNSLPWAEKSLVCNLQTTVILRDLHLKGKDGHGATTMRFQNVPLIIDFEYRCPAGLHVP